ncbi:MAG: polysaccharide biosynthesis/export family protein [Verrucomicrobia bacterium]|nr:polysaccharide biosynthesis/export family protein [Verrucomicrobiota bacterium]
MRFLNLLLFLVVACTNPPYRGAGVCGADDFVIDSYQVREGKFAILSMDGECYDCLDCSLLEPYDDVIQEGDLLKIAIYHPTRTDIGSHVGAIGQTIGYRVACGQLQLPDLPCIDIAGLTLSEAKEKIESIYRDEIQDIEVYITYQERSMRKVELMGLVEKSVIPVDGQIRLFEVLALAKVPVNANFFKSYVVRDCQMLPVDLYRLIKEGDMSQNIVMRGGDKIYIADPCASSLMVLGEVNTQRVVALPNGFMTLRQALAEAGGIPITGDKRYIQVIRGNIVHPKIYTIHWEHVVRLPSESLLLIPGDIVYVAATPIAEWDRFVNQILPTLVGFDLVTRGAKNVGVILP